MTRNFEYRKIKFKKDEGGWLVVSGEIINCSGRNYNSVVFRIILFIKSIPVGNVNLVINGFYSGQTKVFEKQISDLVYDKVANHITQWEMYSESAY